MRFRIASRDSPHGLSTAGRAWAITLLLVGGWLASAPAPAQTIKAALQNLPGQLGPAPTVTEPIKLPPDGARALTQQLPAVDRGNRQAVVDLFKTIYGPALQLPNDWTGSVPDCIAGTTSAIYADMTMNMVNYFRAMAGLPAAVVHEAVKDRMSQLAALMMTANGSLSHSPPASWNCYSPEGAEAAGHSNLALGMAGARAVRAYMEDYGATNTSVGHRRWILYPPSVEMGTGSTDASTDNGDRFAASNALWVIFPFGPRPLTPETVAWPPAGFVPYQLAYPRWSFSVNTSAPVSFAGATVSMTHGGGAVSLTVLPEGRGYGDNTIVWEPADLTFASGHPDDAVSVQVNNVLVDGVAKNYTYDVIVIDAGPLPPTDLFADAVTRNSFYVYVYSEGASGYRLDVSTSNSFDTYINGYQDRDVGNSSYAQVSGLAPNTQYFFRARAYSAGGISANSVTGGVRTAAVTAPVAPTGVTAARGDGQVALEWTAPLDDGGSPITGFEVELATTALGPFSVVTACSAAATMPRCTVTGLTNGITYYFRVAAINAIGPGAFSGPATATPATIPGVPTGLIGTPGDREVSLVWAAPMSNGGAAVQAYVVHVTGPFSGYLGSFTTSLTVTGLINGVRSTFSVAAVNEIGLGAPSAPVYVTPGLNPNAPPLFTDEPLLPRSTSVKQVHIAELRNAVAVLRTRFGLPAVTWTDATLTAGASVIKASHLLELRNALADVYEAAGLPMPTSTQPLVTAQVTLITASDITELRAAVRAIWQIAPL